jgi:cyclophilin family peptidyl-prolyl cis-trans isomerase
LPLATQCRTPASVQVQTINPARLPVVIHSFLEAQSRLWTRFGDHRRPMAGRIALLLVGMAAVGSGVAGARDLAEGASVPKVAETCPRVQASPPRVAHLKAPPQTVTRSDRLEALVKTNCGPFTIALDSRRFPVVVNSFVYLARLGFYDGLRFDQVVPGFVIQGGDTRGNGTGGPGYRVIDPPPWQFRYRVGMVAMAKTRAEPRGSAGSDFFVVLGYAETIRQEYAVIGQVRAGMSTVRQIGSLATNTYAPSQVVKIESIRIRKRGAA